MRHRWHDDDWDQLIKVGNYVLPRIDVVGIPDPSLFTMATTYLSLPDQIICIAGRFTTGKAGGPLRGRHPVGPLAGGSSSW